MMRGKGDADLDLEKIEKEEDLVIVTGDEIGHVTGTGGGVDLGSEGEADLESEEEVDPGIEEGDESQSIFMDT